MWSELNPENLWGRPEQYNNYFRFNVSLDTGIDDGVFNKIKGTPEACSKRLHYGNGLFYIFKTTSKKLNFKYKFHHSDKDDYASSRLALVEPQLCGKLKNSNKWIMLNTSHLIDKTYPEIAEKEWLVNYNFTEDFEEFQFCLPFGAVFYYVFVDFDIEIIKPKKLSFGFLGSSIANMSACFASCSLPAQLYRELNINSCNLAIPLSNSVVYDKLLNYIKARSDIKWFLLDTVNLCEKNIQKIEKYNIKFACIKSRWSNYIFKVNYIFELDNPVYNRDHLHLTTAGAYAFVQKLLPLLKEEL